MPNELIWLILLIFTFGTVLAVFRYFGKLGLYILISVAAIATNIQVFILTDLFFVTVTLGNITYGTIFLISDIFNEYYSAKEARLAVKIGFFSIVVFTLLMIIAISFTPNMEGVEYYNHLKKIFSIQPRVIAASLIAYLISQNLDIWLYRIIRKKLPQRKYLWIRNNGSTIVSQLVDTTIFTSFAFGGIFSLPIITQVFFTTFVMKWLVALIDTPIIYLAGNVKKKVDMEGIDIKYQ